MTLIVPVTHIQGQKWEILWGETIIKNKHLTLSPKERSVIIMLGVTNNLTYPVFCQST